MSYQAVYVDTFKKVSYVRDEDEGWIVDEYKPYAYKKDKDGKYTGLFGDKFKKIKPENYQKGDLSVHEQDIDPTLRVLTDKYLNEDSPPKSHRMVIFDIETEINGSLTPANIKKAINKITSIALLDKTTNKRYCLIIDDKNRIGDSDEDNLQVITYKKESLLLKGFLEIWEQLDPTIIIGYNSSYFDVPYLFYRISKVLSTRDAYRLSPIGIVREQEWSDTTPVKICGLSSIDYLLLHKKFVPKVQPSYKLGDICKKEIGKGKLDFGVSLDKLLETNIKGYIDYNVNDVTLLDELDTKLGFLDLAITISHFAHTEYENIYFSSIVLDGVIYTFLKRKGIVSPNKPQTNDPSLKKDRNRILTKSEEEEEGFLGGYVKDVKLGLSDWVLDLDIASEYPSLIISLNIGYETCIGRIVDTNLSDKDTLRAEYLNMRDIDCIGEYVGIEKLDKSTKTVKVKNLKKQILDNKWSVSGNGIIFRTDTPSILNTVCTEWFKKRKHYKDLMIEARNNLDFEKAQFFDTYQQVYKVFLNSLYGVLAINYRYTDPYKWLSSATTVSGRIITQDTIKFTNRVMNSELGTDNDYVIASDTDSEFFTCTKIVENRLGRDIKDIADEEIISLLTGYGVEMAKGLNSYYDELCKVCFNLDTHRIVIKPEYVIKRAYWSAKKKYALWLVSKEGTPIKKGSEIDYKGLDLMKSNFAPLFKRFSIDMINTLLYNGSKEVIDKMVIDFKEKILKLDYKELSTPTGLKQPLEKYIMYEPPKGQIFSKTNGGTPAHFKASIRYNDLIRFYKKDKEFQQLRIGDPVAFCYLTPNPYKIDSIGFPANDEFPEEIAQIAEKYLDKHKNFDNQLLTKIQKFYDTLNWGKVNLNAKKLSTRWNRK